MFMATLGMITFWTTRVSVIFELARRSCCCPAGSCQRR
jgi:hypothetical protein